MRNLLAALLAAALAVLVAVPAAAPAAPHKRKHTKCRVRHTDRDGDCLANTKDRDIDGDRKANPRDRDMDGDRVPNSRDPDVDGDGVPNTKDRQPFGVVVRGTKFGRQAPGRLSLTSSRGAATVPPGARVPRSFFGVVAEDALAQTGPDGAPVTNALQQAGVGLLRQTFDWANIELSPGRYDFSAYDNFVADAARHRITILPVLFDPPSFRSSSPGNERGTAPPSSNAEFADFAALLVRRYGHGGSFWADHPDLPALPIGAWQVWNEPNLPAYWPSGPNAAQYAAMLIAVGDAIRAADPQAIVVTAGLPDSRLGRPAAQFLAGIYAAGARGHFQAVGANPYATTADGVLENLRALRAQIARAGDDAGIWATEIGWASSGTAAPFDLGAQAQAQAMQQTLPLLAAQAKQLGLLGVVYYAWRDLPVYQGGKDFWGLHTGMIKGDGSPKPALRAFTDVVVRLTGAR